MLLPSGISGSHSVTATYNGDGNYSGSTSTAAVEQTVIGPPVASAGPDQTIAPKSVTRLDGSGSTDPQNEPLTYSWTQVDGPAATITDPSDPRTTVTVPAAPGDVTLQLTVTNSFGLSSTSQVVLHVNAPK